MNLMNFGREQVDNGTLNDMLRQVGIDDVNSFVNQFRNMVDKEAAEEKNAGNANSRQASGGQQPDFVSIGSSLFNQFSGGSKKGQSKASGDLMSGAMNAYKMFSGGKGSSGNEGKASGASSTDMINNAMKVYKMFSGNKGASSGSAGGSGNIFDTIGTTYESAQSLQSLLKSLDRNGDGKITIEDIQLLLEGLGFRSVSPQLSKALFNAVDQNGNGELDLTDVMALAAIVSKLHSRFGTATQKTT